MYVKPNCSICHRQTEIDKRVRCPKCGTMLFICKICIKGSYLSLQCTKCKTKLLIKEFHDGRLAGLEGSEKTVVYFSTFDGTFVFTFLGIFIYVILVQVSHPNLFENIFINASQIPFYFMLTWLYMHDLTIGILITTGLALLLAIIVTRLVFIGKI